MTRFRGGFLRPDTNVPPPPPDPPPPPGGGDLELFVWGPNSLSSTVMAAYNCTTAIEWYWTSTFDKNTDGFRDTPDSSFSLNRSPTVANSLGQLDWEGITGTGSLSGISSHTRCLCGYIGTAAQQDICEQQAISTVDYYRANRPYATRYNFYDVPHSNLNFNTLISQTGTWWNVPNIISSTWVDRVDAITPSCYTRWQQGVDDYPNTVSQTTLYTAQANRAINAMRLAAKGSTYKQVFPMVSRHYYANVSTLSFHDDLAPIQWFYHHCRALANARLSGRKIDGIFLWDKNSVSALDENYLKAAYQGLHELPFDLSMPRPS